MNPDRILTRLKLYREKAIDKEALEFEVKAFQDKLKQYDTLCRELHRLNSRMTNIIGYILEKIIEIDELKKEIEEKGEKSWKKN